MGENKFSTGLIEGFYGKPWSWDERTDILDFLRSHGYSYYIYAPKCDRKLRVEWQEQWSQEEFENIKNFKQSCVNNNISFGVGLSPFELYLNWTDVGKRDLINKLIEINKLDADIIWILFDNMTGNRDDMARLQIEITHFIKKYSTAKKIAMCPTYYSYDPVLKALFGDIPENYMEELGESLNPDIDIIWTGPRVCSKEITSDHLKEVNSVFKRKVLLWDNYPVNDSVRMTPFLHLHGIKNRDRKISELAASHTLNPMVQPYLTRLAMATLNDLYTQDKYDPEQSWDKYAKKLLGEEFANSLKVDIDDFANRGVDVGIKETLLNEWENMIEGTNAFKSLSKQEKDLLVNDRIEFEIKIKNCFTKNDRIKLMQKYGFYNNNYAQEIVKWLMGYYFFNPQLFS